MYLFLEKYLYNLYNTCKPQYSLIQKPYNRIQRTELTSIPKQLLLLLYGFSIDRLASLWRANDKEVMTLTIPEDCEDFKSYYDALQEKISQLSVLDELLSGMYILPLL